MTQENTMQFPFETTTKDGRKATVLGTMPDCRLAGYIDLTEEGFGFETCDWESDGSYSDPGLSIALPLQIKPLTTYRMRNGGIAWTSGLVRDGRISGMDAEGNAWRWHIADGRRSVLEESHRDLIEEIPSIENQK